MIHTPKVSFACHRECSFDRTYIQQRKERCERDFRCVSCSRSSSPWCPQLILSLSILREQTCTTRKSTDTERLRETLQPRLKYQEQHALSLSRDVHARGERERHTRETRREHKAHLVTQSMRVFPQRTNALFSIERTSLSVRI